MLWFWICYALTVVCGTLAVFYLASHEWVYMGLWTFSTVVWGINMFKAFDKVLNE